MNLLRPETLDALAREHALGTLHGGARRRFERLLRDSATARAALTRWQEHFAVLAAAAPPMQPREAVWRALQQRVGAPMPGPAASPTQPGTAAGARRRGVLAALGGALAATLATAVVGTALLRANPGWLGHEKASTGLPASYVGLLSDEAGRPVLLLSARRQGRVLTAKLLQPLPAPAGRQATLWAYPKDGAAPFKVGVLPANGSAALALPQPAEPLFFPVDRLGVSFEPEGTEPSVPGAPLVLQGPCVKLW